MAPSALAIATSSLNRLVKEEKSYHAELEQQKARITKLEQSGSGDENAEFTLRQERRALEETKAIFPKLREKIQEAHDRLEHVIEQDKGPGDQSTPEDITKAKEAIAAAKTALRETA
ncbi:hypothetical protein BAUCODRAFT_34889 [Baudoinia panamericana UAMH 10762]|uniref:Tubulin-specific chaperone A n=1 Tax=Baudoinia panamericana (strain UAMH 10762) TaxID=717646 RepID=M2NB71_BAUPA|nr:uncharacterized protein BAUCODRAFT_34889 [Baudoinia panamericana UAMH 10762]EMC96105.1 hypothetical protein BAUCODRAFT_34889 [Baudoinia panamericana UAMH 10762]